MVCKRSRRRYGTTELLEVRWEKKWLAGVRRQLWMEVPLKLGKKRWMPAPEVTAKSVHQPYTAEAIDSMFHWGKTAGVDNRRRQQGRRHCHWYHHQPKRRDVIVSMWSLDRRIHSSTVVHFRTEGRMKYTSWYLLAWMWHLFNILHLMPGAMRFYVRAVCNHLWWLSSMRWPIVHESLLRNLRPGSISWRVFYLHSRCWRTLSYCD